MKIKRPEFGRALSKMPNWGWCFDLLVKNVFSFFLVFMVNIMYLSSHKQLLVKLHFEISQLTFLWLKSTLKALEKGMKYVQS